MFYVYFVTNKANTVLYIGVTNDLQRRMYEHKNKITEGFTSKYCADKLVYFETFENAKDAISREKQLKGLKRIKKDELVKSMNLHWVDLSAEWK